MKGRYKMQELIKINQTIIGTETTNSVNSRELHQTLEIGRDYSNWMKNQIETLGLDENVDYILLALNGEQVSHGGHNAKDYIITTDTAKHIAMASRTPKGKEVRAYFIEMEKQMNEAYTHPTNEEHFKDKYIEQLELTNTLLLKQSEMQAHPKKQTKERTIPNPPKELKNQSRWTDKDREIIKEMKLKGYKAQDIANKLGRTLGALYTQIQRSKPKKSS
jgi:phage anti-repressor protein